MLGKLLALLCMGTLVVLMTSAERDSDQYTIMRQTVGKSGDVCTKQGRKCIVNATCVNNRCKCPDGQRGLAEMECVDKGERLCSVAGDPHLVSFGKARVDVDLPCRFRAARFVTKNLDSITNHGTCAIEVFATNELLDGRYVIRSVHISVGITDPALQKHSQFEVYKTREFSVNDSSIYNYQTRVIARDGIWGSSKDTEAGLDVRPSYDEHNNFAVLDIEQCQTRVKYRAFDPRKPKHQRQLPGLTIQAPPHAEFVSGYGDYPSCACGTPSDGRLMYRKRAEVLGLLDDQTAVVFDLLNSKPDQKENPYADKCQALFQLFESLPGTRQDHVQSVNDCGFLVTQPAVAKCLNGTNVAPVDYFTSCLSMTRDPADGCDVMQAAARACSGEKGWYGSKNIECPQSQEINEPTTTLSPPFTTSEEINEPTTTLSPPFTTSQEINEPTTKLSPPFTTSQEIK